jgi:hypothetical protein
MSHRRRRRSSAKPAEAGVEGDDPQAADADAPRLYGCAARNIFHVGGLRTNSETSFCMSLRLASNLLKRKATQRT